jgi:hypothetical protein
VLIHNVLPDLPCPPTQRETDPHSDPSNPFGFNADTVGGLYYHRDTAEQRAFHQLVLDQRHTEGQKIVKWESMFVVGGLFFFDSVYLVMQMSDSTDKTRKMVLQTVARHDHVLIPSCPMHSVDPCIHTSNGHQNATTRLSVDAAAPHAQQGLSAEAVATFWRFLGQLLHTKYKFRSELCQSAGISNCVDLCIARLLFPRCATWVTFSKIIFLVMHWSDCNDQ